MSRAILVALGVLLLSLFASTVATLMGARSAALWLGAPALIMSGWAAAGHLITLDDDAPGGWSNPDNSSKIWHRSLGELVVKACIFAVVLLVVVFWPLDSRGA